MRPAAVVCLRAAFTCGGVAFAYSASGVPLAFPVARPPAKRTAQGAPAEAGGRPPPRRRRAPRGAPRAAPRPPGVPGRPGGTEGEWGPPENTWGAGPCAPPAREREDLRPRGGDRVGDRRREEP